MCRPYQVGTRSTIRTNRDSLMWILNLADVAGRLPHWRLRLLKFDFSVFHRAGIKHQVTEALSRLTATGEYHAPIEDNLPVAVLETELKNNLKVRLVTFMTTLSDEADIRVVAPVDEHNDA